jgi:hypothetical protein
MNQNLVGSILGRSSIKIVYLVWQSSFREEDFFKSTNQKQELPMVAMFVNGLELNEQSL